MRKTPLPLRGKFFGKDSPTPPLPPFPSTSADFSFCGQQKFISNSDEIVNWRKKKKGLLRLSGTDFFEAFLPCGGIYLRSQGRIISRRKPRPDRASLSAEGRANRETISVTLFFSRAQVVAKMPFRRKSRPVPGYGNRLKKYILIKVLHKMRKKQTKCSNRYEYAEANLFIFNYNEFVLGENWIFACWISIKTYGRPGSLRGGHSKSMNSPGEKNSREKCLGDIPSI